MKTIIVTGASKGLGLEVVRTLVGDLGCNVVALSRTCSPELRELEGDKLLVLAGDVSNEHDQTRAAQLALERYGSIDGLVLNAGMLEPMARIADANLDDCRRHFDVNFFSLMTMLKIAIPHLRKTRGRVVLTSSGAATGKYAAWSVYNASKAALNSLCRTAAAEEQDITFVAVRPGVLDTGMQELLRASGKGQMTDVDYQKFSTLHTEGRLLAPCKPGRVLAMLAVYAEAELSGEFVDWQDERFKSYGTSH